MTKEKKKSIKQDYLSCLKLLICAKLGPGVAATAQKTIKECKSVIRRKKIADKSEAQK